MRRVLATLGALVLLATLSGGASAAPPARSTFNVQDAGCFGLPIGAGSVDFSGYVDDFGSDAWLDLWSGVSFESDLLLTRDGDLPATIAISGDTVELSIPVVSTGVDPSVSGGNATVSGTLTEADAIRFNDTFHDGNQTFRITVEGVLYALTGTLTLPGEAPVDLDPAFCQGGDVVQEEFISRPNARVISYTSGGGFCQLANADGDTGVMFPFVGSDFVFVDATITDDSGADVALFGEGLLDAAGSASFPTEEYDPETGESVGTTGWAEISVVGSGETFSFSLKTSNGFVRIAGTLLDLEGSLSTSLGDFDLGGCTAEQSRVKEVTTSSSGPKPGGKRPANDLPSGAVTLKPGGKATVATRGAQVAAEAPYPCLTFTDPFDGTEYSWAGEHTVWYRIGGTGGNVTFDTAGSDFDTVIAVYAGAPGGQVVACVDDTEIEPVGRTLQGRATFATQSGTPYWVQVGGLNEEPVGGPDPFVPYGTLKVAVR